jgi:hypothetical protein
LSISLGTEGLRAAGTKEKEIPNRIIATKVIITEPVAEQQMQKSNDRNHQKRPKISIVAPLPLLSKKLPKRSHCRRAQRKDKKDPSSLFGRKL